MTTTVPWQMPSHLPQAPDDTWGYMVDDDLSLPITYGPGPWPFRTTGHLRGVWRPGALEIAPSFARPEGGWPPIVCVTLWPATDLEGCLEGGLYVWDPDTHPLVAQHVGFRWMLGETTPTRSIHLPPAQTAIFDDRFGRILTFLERSAADRDAGAQGPITASKWPWHLGAPDGR